VVTALRFRALPGIILVRRLPVDALFWTAVINGLLAPPLLVLVMLIANNQAVMGDRTNTMGLNVVGWATTAAMFAAAIGLVLTLGQS
jgi:Mn2+/Fe2+ NRAMP family transporter